jgi:hypothetical protein
VLIEHLLEQPDAATPEGENSVDAVVGDLVERAAKAAPQQSAFGPDESDFAVGFPTLARALARDGFVVEGGRLRRAPLAAMDVPAADDEVHELLKRFGFSIAIGHLDQAIQSHADGRRAAANGQLRSFIEGLINDIAEKLVPQGAALPPPGGARLNWLATLKPPFVLAPLNEWDGQGEGFLEAFSRRLHPHGSHPGLSDDDDSTFRLHIVLVVARLLLRRLAQRLRT